MAVDSVVRWIEKRDREVKREVAKGVRGRMAKAGDVVKKSLKQSLSGSSPAPAGQPPGKADGRLVGSIKRKTFGGDNPGFIVLPRTERDKEVFGRLQKGFVGRDARGRVYNQRPRPTTGPALERVSGEVLRKITDG